MKYEFKFVSSLEKVFFEKPEHLKEQVSGSMFQNEIYSFQLVGWTREYNTVCTVEIESDLAPYLQIREIGYVPSILPTIPDNDDNDYITKTPGLFPDPLYKLKNGQWKLVCGQSRALWITVEPDEQAAGIYPIFIKIFNEKKEELAQLCYTMEIINAKLPKQKLYNTGWFHGDCIAKLHHVEMFSEEYWKLIEKYIGIYTKFGHNMILTPVFTPPLDTAIGKERPTNQLVDVYVNEGNYSFDFIRLKRWINLCLSYGIEYFEISHLFTQWGAKHAPKIMAYVDGVLQKIFGWETDALSEEYRNFLNPFLSSLLEFLQTEKIADKCFFHISDEPQEEHLQQYKSAKDILLPFIEESQIIDALSSYCFYEKGIVKNPVVASDHIHIYLEHKVKNLWTYYCMAQRKDVANRFMAMPSYRNRILGYQLYKYQIKGFLHWGFNFWFSALSESVINPYLETAADAAFPSGDPFIVYPTDKDQDVICSLRLYVFQEGLQDMRALELLESLTDRQTVVDLLDEIVYFNIYPRQNDYLLELREKINQKIKKMLP